MPFVATRALMPMKWRTSTLRWTDSNDGRDGLMTLINGVAAGEEFSEFYRDFFVA